MCEGSGAPVPSVQRSRAAAAAAAAAARARTGARSSLARSRKCVQGSLTIALGCVRSLVEFVRLVADYRESSSRGATKLPKTLRRTPPTRRGAKNKAAMGRNDADEAPEMRWWARIEDECPITLEAIATMTTAPFFLDGSYFDADSLHGYLIDTGRLENPCTRAPLSRPSAAAGRARGRRVAARRGAARAGVGRE